MRLIVCLLLLYSLLCLFVFRLTHLLPSPSPPVVSGAWAEKLKFNAFLVFVTVWPFLVYYPLAHWIWNPQGWLANLGVLDFAGGLTIHTSSGVAALVVSACLQRRKAGHDSQLAHHNIPLAVLGASLIWGGWYSFNGGSAYKANAQAGYAIVNTHIAACAGGLTWVIFTRLRAKHWALMEVVNGALAGLATVTPASGFVEPWSALVIGAIGGLVSYWTVILFKEVLRLDDVLDVSSLQGVPGLIGSALLGIFASPALTGNPDQCGVVYAGASWKGLRFLGFQLLGCLVAALWSAVWTTILMAVMRRVLTIDVTAHEEEIGLDLEQIGEQAYDERLALIDDLGLAGATKQLLLAAGEGNAHKVRDLLRNGVHVDVADYDGRTALHLAASEGRVELCKILLKACLDESKFLAMEDRFGRTPLEDAVAAKHDTIVTLLRGRGATMRSTEELGFAMLNAASQGNVVEVRRLMECGVDPNLVDYDARSALHLGAVEGHINVVKVLLRYGADSGAIDRWDQTPVDEARNFGHTRMIRLLIAARDSKSTLLSLEPIHGGSHPTVIPRNALSKRRRASCASLGNARKKTQSELSFLLADSPVSEASSIQLVGSYDSVGNAIASTAEAMVQPRELTASADVAELCDAAERSDSREISRLLSKGADANGKDYDHRTALHIAACSGCLTVLRQLLDVPDINVNCVDRWHSTPLTEALKNDFIEGAELLKSRGAISIDEHVGAKLCAAAARNDLRGLKNLKLQGEELTTGDCAYARMRCCVKMPPLVLALFLSYEWFSHTTFHPFPLTTTDDSRTALALAASNGHAEIVAWLLREGVSKDCMDRYGNTPLIDAKRHGHAAVVAILESS